MSVAIIGGGYAGMAAAVELTRQGIPVSVYETGKTLGGRARRVEYRHHALDNGQHILSGAYGELLSLMHMVGAPDDALLRIPLTLIHRDFRLRAPRLPAPWHLVWALLLARGLSWAERWAAMQFIRALKQAGFRVERNLTVQSLLLQHQQTPNAIRLLWESLCVAALNTPPSVASAQVFVNVLRDSLCGARAASDLLLPRVDLTALFPAPAAKWLDAHSGHVFPETRVTHIQAISAGYRLHAGSEPREYPAVICAVGAHQLELLAHEDSPLLSFFRDTTGHFQYEPIYTIYIQYPASIKLAAPLVGQTTGITQWFFDREALTGNQGLVAAVVSASGPHQKMEHHQLANQVHQELETLTGTLPLPVWSKIIAEKRATFACHAGLKRPCTETPFSGLFLAGDYTESPYPATLEGAVRSGRKAARHCADYLRNL